MSLSGWCGVHGTPDCDGCERHGKAATCACAGCVNRRQHKGNQRGFEQVIGENETSPNGAQTPPGSDHTFLTRQKGGLVL